MKHLDSEEWIQFLKNIHKARIDLGDPKTIWYRGQSNSDHNLIPSLLRYKNGIEKEQFLFNKFRRYAHKNFQNLENDWETLFDMQHYHIPTRLIDWSDSFGISLFFAAQISRIDKTDAAIYVLNPIALNQYSKKKNIIRIPTDEMELPYKDIYWNNKPFEPTAPVAIEPNFKNDRILAQRGNFTVHHNEIDAIEDAYPKAIKKIILPNKALLGAIDFLEIANINEYSVFPDMAGMANYIVRSADLKNREKATCV